MSQNPYQPLATDTTNSVVITDAAAFQMPRRCAVCGVETTTLLTYTQDHLPFLVPGLEHIPTTEVMLPYCLEHAKSFQRRFRNLRMSQHIAFAALFVLSFAALPPIRQMLDWNGATGILWIAIFVALFLFLVASIFCIKPRLYDAFFKVSGNRISIKSRSAAFISHVIEANRGIVQRSERPRD